MPTTSGSSQMSVTYTNQVEGQKYVLTGKTVCTALGIDPTQVDAIKITSIICQPRDSGAPQEVNFAEGAKFVASDRMKPTKIRPSQLSPAGRWTKANSDVELATVTGGVASAFILNVAVRRY